MPCRSIHSNRSCRWRNANCASRCYRYSSRLVFSRAIDSCLSAKQNNNVRLFLAGDHLALERKSNRTDWLCPFEESHVDIDASWWLRTRPSDQRRYIQCIRLVGGWEEKKKTLFSLCLSFPWLGLKIQVGICQENDDGSTTNMPEISQVTSGSVADHCGQLQIGRRLSFNLSCGAHLSSL